MIHRLKMPHTGDELHHFGWNACASCHGERARRFLVVPGLVSGRIHVIDTEDQRRPAFHKVIEPKEVATKAGLTGPHIGCAGTRGGRSRSSRKAAACGVPRLTNWADCG